MKQQKKVDFMFSNYEDRVIELLIKSAKEGEKQGVIGKSSSKLVYIMNSKDPFRKLELKDKVCKISITTEIVELKNNNDFNKLWKVPKRFKILSKK